MNPMQLAIYASQLYIQTQARIDSWSISPDWAPALQFVTTLNGELTDSPIQMTPDDFPDAIGVLFNRPVYLAETPGIVLAIHVPGGLGFIDTFGRIKEFWAN